MPHIYYKELYYNNGRLAYAGMGYDRDGTFILHGKGKYYHPETGKLHYEGDFVDNNPTGKGKYYSPKTGHLIYEGDCVDGKPHGEGKAYYAETGRLRCEGDFVDGKPHGKGKAYDSETGQLIYEGDFADGKMSGKGKLYDLNTGRLRYEGDFADNKMSGKGKLYNPDTGRLVYEGDYVDGKWTGKGKLYDLDTGKLRYEGDFVNDKQTGKGKMYDPDTGKLVYEGDFIDGEPVRQFKQTNGEKDLDACLRELNDMIGLVEVKAQVQSLVNLIRLQNERKERNLPVMPMSFHLVFTGNPGTGKTTVARLLAQIYANLGVVSKGTLVETDRAGLVAGYLGQTALKTDEVINQARGGILFIDEAYSLVQDRQDQYGMEAIDCIMKRMEDYRDDFVVIATGYQEPMNQFLETNPGLKSRFNRHIHFENYNISELMEILAQFTAKNGYTMEDECKKMFQTQIEARMEDQDFLKQFSNGRYIRNLFEKMVFAQSNRLSQINISMADNHVLTNLTVQDLQYIINNHEFERTF